MKRISITVDDKTLNLLDGEVNKSETLRKALGVYNGAISPDTIQGFRVAFERILEKLELLEEGLKESDSKIDYIARKLDDSIQ